MVNQKAKTINIRANSKKEFFLLHGYTGSPTDFNELGKYLNKRFNAHVKIIRLKGHGTQLSDLDGLDYLDFYKQAERELKKDIKKGREIILGGISVGSLIALHLSTKFKTKGVLCFSNPYKPTFMVGIISFLEPIIFKKHWIKPILNHEKELRKKAFFYDVHLRGFRVIKQSKKAVTKLLDKVNSPCLVLHVEKDYVFHKKGAEFIYEKINSKKKKLTFFKGIGKISHNPFYSPGHRRLYKIIGDFVQKNRLFYSK
jgi:esterase/lipase